MPLITWSDKLSVGVKSIDAQHGRLVDTLNELHEAMLRGQAKEITGRLLKTLLRYTHDHFSAEEAILARADYPKLEAHKVLHRDLTRKVEAYIARYEKGEIALNSHLLNFLRDWLTNHIQQEDRAYGPCLTARGIR